MKKTIVTLIAFFAIAATALAQKSMIAVPPTANLQQYPIETGPLSIKKQADMNLRPMELKKDWTGLNLYVHLRGDGRWVYETLPAGTMVLADSIGNPIYKVSCGNRLVAMPKSKSVTPVPTVPPRRPGSWPQWFFNILAALILLILLALLAWLIYLLFSNLAERRSHGGNDNPQGGGGGAQPTPQGGSATSGPGSTNQPPKPSGQQQPPEPGAGTATEDGKEKDQPQPPAADSSEGKGSTAKFVAFYQDKDGGMKINFSGHNRVTHRINERGEHSISFS